MSRDYNEKAKEIMLNGFFSEYLPPCFQLSSKVLLKAPKKACDLITPYSFTMSKHAENGDRRTIFIPEIGSYITTYNYMKENNIFKELIEFIESCDHSFSPILKSDDTILRHEQAYDYTPTDDESPKSDYINNIAEKIIRSSGTKKILKLDISNCYSSLYMHMVPAIILGADKTENEYKKFICNPKDTSISPQYLKYKGLDAIIRRQNLNRTNGILTGPLFSRLVIEAILTRLDKELEIHNLNFVRYVDDYEVFLTEENEKTVISIFTSVLKKYGFTLNSEKTELIEFPFYLVENFQKILLAYPENMDDANIIDIFTIFSNMEKSGVKGALRFLLKTLEKKPPKLKSLELYKSYLITIMANNERSLIKACSILINEFNDKITTNDIENIVKLLETHIEYEHDLEVIWLLYFLIKTNTINNDVIKSIIETKNELAQVMLLNAELLSDKQIKSLISNAESWILLYELYANNSLDESDFKSKLNLNNNYNMYKYFKNNNIHFLKY